MLDIRYRIDRMKALHAMKGDGPTETQGQQLDELYQARDEDGILTLLEGTALTPQARKMFEVLKQAKLVGERLTELSRTIPLPHEKIQELYPQIRHLKLEYECLTTDADRSLTRV